MKNQLQAVRVTRGKIEVVVFEDSLSNIYAILGCSTIDIITRYVNGKPYLFVVDDEGCLKDGNPMTAVDVKGKEALFGKFLIVNTADEAGNLVSLTDEDIEFISHSAWHYMFVYSTQPNRCFSSGVKGQA